MRRSVSACLLGAALLTACAAPAPPRPVTDADTRLEFYGFSLLPPPGAHWYFGPQGPYGVVLGKRDPAMAGEAQTFVVSARLFDTEGVKVDTPEALSRSFSERYLPTLTSERVRLVDSKVRAYRDHGTDCLRYEVVLEERDNAKLPGALLVLTDHGFQCRHPDSSRHVVHVYYSGRHVRGRPAIGGDLAREAEVSLESVRFVPISQRFDERVNCVSGGERRWVNRSQCD